jgi:osmotically-inducible protein OsmY
MKDKEQIVTEVAAALEREPAVNIHSFPVQIEFNDGVLTLEGELERITAKKKALEAAAAVPGVSGIVDRLRHALTLLRSMVHTSAGEAA